MTSQALVNKERGVPTWLNGVLVELSACVCNSWSTLMVIQAPYDFLDAYRVGSEVAMLRYAFHFEKIFI